jgi:hypothetical protein
LPNEIEILVVAKDLAKATFEATKVETKDVAAAADKMDLAMRRAGLSAAVAGDNAERAMTRAAGAT